MSKPTLYFLPGTMCDETLWVDVWPELEAGFELVALAIPKENSFEKMAKALTSQLPGEPANLVGFSLGGYLASYFASCYPDRVKQLLNIANSPCGLPESELKQRRQTLAWLKHAEYKGAVAQRIQQLLGIKSKNDFDMIKHIQQMERSVGLEQLVPQLTASSERDDLTAFFQHTDIPVMFLFGSEDVLVNFGWFHSLSNPNIKQKYVEEVGHMMPLESPEVVAGAIKAFFGPKESV